MSPYGALVMDFDGTILDTEWPVYASWARVFETHGVELSLEEWQEGIGSHSFDPWARLLEAGLVFTDEEAERLQQARRDHRDDLQRGIMIRPGVEQWLSDAARLGVPVGVASSSSAGWVDSHLRRLGLRGYFSCLSCCDGVIPAKPDPTSYRVACLHLGRDPERSVAVEDSANGVTAARGAGLFTVAVPHDLTAGLDFSHADLRLASLADLSLEEAFRRMAQVRPL